MKAESHFAKSRPEVRATYDAILRVSRSFGAVTIEPKKTSIHLVRTTAFAGVSTRKDALILTVKSAAAIKSARVLRAQQTSARRWHIDVRLTSPRDVDRDVRAWLKTAYELAA
jgi:hypothetical protein